MGLDPDFAVLDEKQNPDFILRHSTALYPEWYFCANPGTDADLQARMKQALLAVKDTSELAQSAKIKGFVDALPLDGLRQALQTLNIPPFDKP